MQEVSVGDEQWHLFRWGHGRGGAIRKSSIKSCRLWSAFGLNGHGSHFRDFRRGPAWRVGATKMVNPIQFLSQLCRRVLRLRFTEIVQGMGARAKTFANT